MSGAGAQHLAQGLGARNRVAQQHEARGRPVEVELRQKGVEHLLAGESPVGAGKIGAVAPVLVGAEEERLDAELPRLLADREHVRFGDRARIDALLALDRRQRADPVAQPRRLLEFKPGGGLAHLVRESLADRAAAAGKEVAGLADQFGIVVERDLAGARAGAALDLIEQAGPGAVLVEAVRAGAQQERALQRVEGAEDRPGAGEGTEIVARRVARAAMLDQPRGRMPGADEDIGEALVVAQRHVVAGLQLLDEIGLEQQRLGVRLGGDENHRARLGDHARDAARLAFGRGVGGDALLDRARLADVEHLALRPDHPIDARAERRVTPERLDRLGAARNPRRLDRRLVEAEIERRRIRGELARQRRFGPGFGLGSFAGRKGIRRASHRRAYLGAAGEVGNSLRSAAGRTRPRARLGLAVGAREFNGSLTFSGGRRSRRREWVQREVG